MKESNADTLQSDAGSHDVPATPEQWALAYRARGWSVIPVRPRDKRPMVKWTEFQKRLAGEDEIHSWYLRRPDANVGIVTGQLSGIIVLDVDAGHGGVESLKKLERVHGQLQRSLMTITGGGGRHFYFAHPGGTEIRNQVGLYTGIDVRGDGGYVVAPPSVHPSGNVYAWASPENALQKAPEQPPGWLLTRLFGHRAQPGQPVSHWRELTEHGVEEGQRNNVIASLAGYLLSHGLDADVVLQLLLGWNRLRCQPPLPEGEVERTVGSISRLHAERSAPHESVGPFD